MIIKIGVEGVRSERMIKNEYLSIKDYEKYLSLFNLKGDDRKEINNIINKV